jgi:hypothetical protein
MLKTSGQIPLPIDVFREADRNFELGGRSFYFFDFDDNVVHLGTKIMLFNKQTGEEFGVSTADFATVAKDLGKAGTEWAHFEAREDPITGSYKRFRDDPALGGEGRPQYLITDMLTALGHPFLDWRGPSWDFFVHAVNNNRPIAVITARGHHPHTIRRAINLLVVSRDLEASPNYLSVYPVSNPEIRHQLGDTEMKWSTGELKKAAIRAAVKDAFECYELNPHHRFGMSDDDPHNVALILQAMKELKKEYPENAFYVFNTHGRQMLRHEVLLDDKTQDESIEAPQMSLFGTSTGDEKK